jgi:hypothetical protein
MWNKARFYSTLFRRIRSASSCIYAGPHSAQPALTTDQKVRGSSPFGRAKAHLSSKFRWASSCSENRTALLEHLIAHHLLAPRHTRVVEWRAVAHAHLRKHTH